MEEIIKRLIKFRDERNWEQFHTPDNLAKSIVIEASELLINYQYDDTYFNLENSGLGEQYPVWFYCPVFAGFTPGTIRVAGLGNKP